MSQKDQEAAIDERIERIRKRNEEIQRRHLEVEADKLNAEKLNAAVKFTPPDLKNIERKTYSRPQPVNRNPRFERKIPDKPYVAKPQVQGKKFSTFSEGDGPPPDPVYTFLSDYSRDVPKGDEKAAKENSSDDEFRGSRGNGRGRGWTRGRGNARRGGRRGAATSNQSPRQVPEMQPEYQAWRAEREKIDQDRITRQKTAEGNWRREWDSEKLSQDENQEFQARPAFSKKKKRDSEELKIQRTVVNELAVSSPPPKEIDTKTLDKALKMKSSGKGTSTEKKTVVFKVNEGSSSEKIKVEPEEHFVLEQRNIISCGDSIKISVSNKPIKSVRVNPVNAAGTGRVGPRQKPKLSYSSQSEDEKEMLAPILRKRPSAANQNESPSTKVDVSKKPPLPPLRGNNSSPRKKQTAGKAALPTNKEIESLAVEKMELSRESSRENVSEGGDDSWEDVATTSGNESADFSDADMTKRPDEGETTADEEVKIEAMIKEEVSAKKEEEVLVEEEEVPAKEEEKLAKEEEEVLTEEEEVPAKEEEKPAKEVEEVLTEEEKVPAKEEEKPAKEEEEILAREEEIPAKGEEVPAKEEEIPAKEEEVLAKLEEVPAKEEKIPAKEEEEEAVKEEVVVAKDVVVEKGIPPKEEKEIIESIKAVEETSLNISKETTVEESIADCKNLESIKNSIGEGSKIFVGEHCEEKVGLINTSEEEGFVEESCEEKVVNNQERNLSIECMNKHVGECLKKEHVKSDLPDLKGIKLEVNNEIIENEEHNVLKIGKDISLPEIGPLDNCPQNRTVSDAPVEDSKQEDNHKESHGNDSNPIIELEET